MRRLVVLLLLAGLAACNEETAGDAVIAPVSMTEEAVGHYCQMHVLTHDGPKAQVHLAGNAHPIWFVQVRDALAFDRMPDQPARVAAIFVSDMGAADAAWDSPGPDNWIDATEAFYVTGSSRRGGMGAPDFIPFSKREDAVAFRTRHGGTVIAYGEIEDATVLAPVDVHLPASAPESEGS